MIISPQFIVYRVIPSTTRPGKTDKIPVAPSGKVYVDAHVPANWMSRGAATAAATTLGAGHGVGFVITEADDYWFIDLDECVGADGQWLPVVSDFYRRLYGAYYEVSVSGRGVHFIGRGKLALHHIKCPALGADLYSKLRFCALTGTAAQGDMNADLTAAINTLAAEHFPPMVASVPSDWTDAPCEGYGGPVDDDDLIRRAVSAVSAAGAIGGKPTFDQLWRADAAALSRHFPDDHGSRDYDASRADAALAQHLAFWTGKDCGRIRRLMERSALCREKWSVREEYLTRTITGACGQQKAVAVARAAPVTASAPVPAAATDEPVLASDLATHFAGAVYIEDRYAAAVPDGSILSPPQFRSRGRYGGAAQVFTGDGKTTRNAWEAFTENALYAPPFAHSLCFRPEVAPRSLVADGGRVLFNSYVPIATPVAEGDPGPFLRHLEKLLPDASDRALLIAWMAFVVQRPGKKAQWAPLIQGCEGNGKTFLMQTVAFCVGDRYSHFPNAQDLANKFNGWIDQKLFIGVEEIYVSERRDVLNALKPLIGNLRIEIQRKGHDQVTGDNRANFMLSTNHKDAVPKTKNDRRYAPLFCAQQEESDLVRDGMTGNYFPKLYAWAAAGGWAICNGYLRGYAIPAALDPGGLAHRAPVTSSTAEAITVSMGPVEQAVQEAIASGDLGFRGGWVSSFWLGTLLDARRLRSRAHPNQWDSLVQSLGYEKHPGLPLGRTNNSVAPDGKRSILWVRTGSIPALNFTNAADIARAYSAAQEPTAHDMRMGEQA